MATTRASKPTREVEASDQAAGGEATPPADEKPEDPGPRNGPMADGSPAPDGA